jgi:hypothetical protein
MREFRKVSKSLAEKPDRNKPLVRHKQRGENNIKWA